MLQTVFLHKPNEYYKYIFNTKYEIHSVIHFENIMCVTYRGLENYYIPNSFPNVVLAAFIAAHARV